MTQLQETRVAVIDAPTKKETRTIAVDTLHVVAAVETTQLAILGFVDDQSTLVTQGLQLSSQSNSSKSVQTDS